MHNPSTEKTVALLCNVIRKEGLRIFDLTNDFEEFQARICCLQIWRPEISLPDFSEAGLLDKIETWAAPFLEKVKRRDDFKKLNLLHLLNPLFSWDQMQMLNKYAPEKIKVPSGSEISLSYTADGNNPVLAVRLQEVFGLSDTPTINEGRTPVLMHLLSPGYKPVQVTQDLRSFWTNIYPEVRKELRVRYQKHSWPEDPWTAEAVRGAKRRKQ